jgi:hypothetical protein
MNLHLIPARECGRQHKAWGVSPRSNVDENQPVERAAARSGLRRALSWSSLPPALQAPESLFALTWGSRPRLYAVACFRRLIE